LSTTTETNGAAPAKELAPIDRSLAAEASSAHSRINVALNQDNWRAYPEELQTQLLWFHQYALDTSMGWQAVQEALGYDQSTIYRVLKGTYSGSLEKFLRAIVSFRDLAEKRASIKKTLFVENTISKIVFTGLDYALQNSDFTTIIGESQLGKSTAAQEWQHRNNHGRSVYITANAVGGAKGFLRRIAEKVGVNRSAPAADIADGIHRAFNRNRILIVDQAHWLVPADPRTSNPSGLNFLIDLYESRKCAIALLATRRLTEAFEKGDFMYEQLVGRTGMPWRIPTTIKMDDILPIVAQFVPNPGPELMAEMLRYANSPGRIGQMVKVLKSSHRVAAKKHERLAEQHVRKAIAFREKMSGRDAR
jgi:hypothetical protein